MATESHVHDGSAWRKLKEWHVHDGTAWRKLKEAWCHDGTAWRKVFGGAPGWQQLGGTIGTVYDLQNLLGHLYAATSTGVHRWDGETWESVGAATEAKNLAQLGSTLYATVRIGGAPYVAYLSGTTWVTRGGALASMPTSMTARSFDIVIAMPGSGTFALNAIGDYFEVGYDYITFVSSLTDGSLVGSSLIAGYFSRWDGSTWTTYGGPIGQMTGAAWFAGQWTAVSGSDVRRWNGSTWTTPGLATAAVDLDQFAGWLYFPDGAVIRRWDTIIQQAIGDSPWTSFGETPATIHTDGSYVYVGAGTRVYQFAISAM